MIKLLTRDEADDLIRSASLEVMQHSHIRYGQALWNSLPQEFILKYTATSADFFYERKDDVAAKKFYEHMVEK